jgi:cytochrome c553
MSAFWSDVMGPPFEPGKEPTVSRRPRLWGLIVGRVRRAVALVRLELILQAAILAVAVAVAGAARAEEPASRGSVQAKLSYCKDCHGPSAQGYRGYFPIPRLAGQQTEYLENQLQAFVEHRRTNNVMFNVAHALSPSMVSALAASFRNLNPAPVGGAPRQFVAEGKKIFEDGVPDANVAACAACHGPDATGTGEIPRLAGQLYPYLIKELTNWGKERGQNPAKPDASAVMSPVAHSLTKAQIEAVSAYLSYLR